MHKLPYALAIGSIMYVMVSTRPDIAHIMGVVIWFMSDPSKQYWKVVMWILRYLGGTTDNDLWFDGKSVKLVGYIM